MGASQADRIKASKDVLLVILAIISSLSVALTDLAGMSAILFKHTLAVLFVFWIVSVYWTLPASTSKAKRSAATGI
jgi:hypothetical protein